ncbi:hypothetical protein BDR03DRAFT_1050057 [Suillus americanus]|nr:hypothetical protein BDR03DRAFT_1050057 [Suillus americanus]
MLTVINGGLKASPTLCASGHWSLVTVWRTWSVHTLLAHLPLRTHGRDIRNDIRFWDIITSGLMGSSSLGLCEDAKSKSEPRGYQWLTDVQPSVKAPPTYKAHQLLQRKVLDICCIQREAIRCDPHYDQIRFTKSLTELGDEIRRESPSKQCDLRSPFQITHRKCLVDAQNPGHDDFELWSPSEERDSPCLFGRQMLYHRRKRDVNCVVGDASKALDKVVQNCRCMLQDFECAFNHIRNGEDTVLTGDSLGLIILQGHFVFASFASAFMLKPIGAISTSSTTPPAITTPKTTARCQDLVHLSILYPKTNTLGLATSTMLRFPLDIAGLQQPLHVAQPQLARYTTSIPDGTFVILVESRDTTALSKLHRLSNSGTLSSSADWAADDVYIDPRDWPLPQMDVEFNIDPVEFQARKRRRMSTMTTSLPPPPKVPPTSAPGVHKIGTFLPGMLEFEHELNNEAEDLVKDREFRICHA